MKRMKKLMVGVVLAVTLLGNCFSVSAANNECQHPSRFVYSKEPAGPVFCFSHTEQHGSVTVFCDVYKDAYFVRWKCVNCHEEVMVTTEYGPEKHITR